MTTDGTPIGRIQPEAAALPPLVDNFSKDSLTLYAPETEWTRSKVIRVALFFLIFVVGFGSIWASTAKIGGAVIASGSVIAEGRNRVIQHLEGGILADIFVREGDAVEAGKPLAQLDTTQTSAQLASAELQEAIFRIQLARRRAEVAEARSFEIPAEIPSALLSHPRVVETIDSQRSEFEAARRLLDTELELYGNQIATAKLQVGASQEFLDAKKLERGFLVDELRDFKELLEKGLTQATQVSARERALAEIDGEIAQSRQQVKASEAEVLTAEGSRKQIRLEYLREANAALVQVQQQLNEQEQLAERLRDVFRRSTIASPVDGTVFQVAARTLGGVIRPGETIMTLFPEGDALTVEAMIEPKDIEQVYMDQPVNVVFPSNRDNSMVPVAGKVTYVSADTVQPEGSPIGFYLVHVRIDDGQDDLYTLLPGNLAEVYLTTDPKTFFQYVTEPITKFAFRAFKG